MAWLRRWVTVILTVCTGAAAAAAQPNATIPAPSVDHHLHLLSEAGAVTSLTEVPLPSSIERLLRQREKRWSEASALAGLYATNARLGINQQWYDGPKAISAFLEKGYTGPYRFRPNAFRSDGTTAKVAGFLLEDIGTDAPFGYFTLDLIEEADGAWRIASEIQLFPGPAIDKPYTAQDLIRNLDEAGIGRGVVLSDAYYFALSPDERAGEVARVRSENDWTAQQVAQFPDRLVAFCSVNPLRSYALAEVERCAASGQFKGLKLHLNAAQIDYQDPKQVAQARRVFQLANRHRLPLIVHVRSSDNYGTADARVFLYQLVAAAPDVPVQIAHLWGGETFAPEALKVYADAVARREKVTRNLYFDVSGMNYNTKPESYPAIVAAMRRIGMDRLLYASDGPPLKSWQAFRKLPLTETEFNVIAHNVAPYMR